MNEQGSLVCPVQSYVPVSCSNLILQ